MSKRICYLCGDSYHYCPNCDEDRNKPQWMFSFCSENCHEIYGTLVSQSTNRISIVETKKALDKLNVQYEKYDVNVQNHINRIDTLYSKAQNKPASKSKRSRAIMIEKTAARNNDITD